MSEFVTRTLRHPDDPKQTKTVKLRTLVQAGAEEFSEPPKPTTQGGRTEKVERTPAKADGASA